MNKKIYSDDFDMWSSDQIIRKKKKMQANAGSSLMECPISEDVESEDNNDHHDYLSDYSSSSTFSFKKKKMSFDLSRFIDKLEPIPFETDSGSSMCGGNGGFGPPRHFYSGAVNETIQEEDDEEAILN